MEWWEVHWIRTQKTHDFGSATLFNKYLLRAYRVSGTLLETWNTDVNRTNKNPALTGPTV